MRTDPNGHIIVLLEEEYGFKYHLWFTGLTSEQLETFWAGIPSIASYYLNPSGTLPGRFEEADTNEEMDAWYKAKKSGEYYSAHLHWEDDSWLRAPGGRLIKHAGFTEEP